MRKCCVFVIFLFFCSVVLHSKPLPVKLIRNVVIDTDCAIDDLRAISLLLSRPEINIKAVFLSHGSLPPREGCLKVKALLHEFGRDTIPVMYSNELKDTNPTWREFSRQIYWGSDTGLKNNCHEISGKLIDESILLLCLGPLTNINQLIANDEQLKNKIERIVWYNSSVSPLKGFNYECDEEAANSIMTSGIELEVISNLQKQEAFFDTTLYNVCKNSKTHLGAFLYKVHNHSVVMEKLNQRHFRLCDELIAVYLTNPELFDVNTSKENKKLRYNQDYNATAIREVISDMILGKYIKGGNVVFNTFPAKPEMFTYDVRQIMDSAIARYGSDEWKANVMTDEFHGHLGVFSIVGVKMGIKARELFGVGPDELEVITYAGTKPPYSCLNDGLQVSTGATLGMGTIHLADSIKQPVAVFTYKGRSFKIGLKKQYLEKVDADISEGIVKFGLMDDGYWKLIRRNALKYWVEWNRDEIFDIEELSIVK